MNWNPRDTTDNRLSSADLARIEERRLAAEKKRRIEEAAPELYQACKKLLGLFDKLEADLSLDDPLREMRKQFHAPYREALTVAIDKAEGR